MIDVREELEAGFIEHAIAVINDEDLAELRSLCTAMRQRAEVGEAFLDMDLDFHATIYRRLNNRVLMKLLDIFCTIYKNLRGSSLLIARNPVAEADKHEESLQAIAAKNVPLARRCMREHFSGIRVRLSAALASE